MRRTFDFRLHGQRLKRKLWVSPICSNYAEKRLGLDPFENSFLNK